MQQPYLSSPPDAGGVPQRPAQVSSQHADAHIPWRSSAPLTAPATAPHPVLSAISWVIAAASAAWLIILAVSLTMIVASGLSHDSEFVMLTYGVYMACAFGFCCFGTFFALHFGLGSSAHWRDSIRHPHHPH